MENSHFLGLSGAPMANLNDIQECADQENSHRFDDAVRDGQRRAGSAYYHYGLQ